MKHLFITLLLLIAGQLPTLAQHARISAMDSLVQKAKLQASESVSKKSSTATPTDTLFRGVFHCKETGVYIFFDPTSEHLLAPSLEFLGPVHGYMSGGIYGVWMLIKHSVKKNTAELHFTNDIGSDSQTIRLTAQDNGNFLYEAINGNVVRKVEGRKLVKITDRMVMQKISKTP